MTYRDICDSASHRDCARAPFVTSVNPNMGTMRSHVWRACGSSRLSATEAEMKAHNAISATYHSLQIFKIDEHISKSRTWHGTRDS